MSRFNITAPDGRVVVVEGDEEPTDEEAEEIFESLPKMRVPKKADPAASFMPSLFRSLMGAVAALNKKVDANAAAAQPPKIVVEAPNVKVDAPDVTVHVAKPPTKWRVRVTERDEWGRASEWSIQAEK